MQVNRARFFQFGQSDYGNSHRKNVSGEQNARTMKRMLSENRLSDQQQETQKVYQGTLQTGIVNDNLSYAESVRMGRTKTKDTSLKLKQLRYDFKSISTQILRSKTSVSARQVASKARREVIRLKRLRQNGEYDDEELQNAISHAQAMERVAKKKMRHLQEEELAKTGGPCEGDLEEKEDVKDDSREWEETDRQPEEAQEELEKQEAPGELMQDQMAQYREMMEAMAKELQALAGAGSERSAGGMMSDMMEDMWDSMRDMMEEMGLEDLEEGMLEGASRDMDPADLKMMKIKHRTKEMKAIAEADSEYLKAVFDKLQRERAGASPIISGGGSSPFSGASEMPSAAEVAGVAPVSVPALAAGSIGGGIDISV